MKKFVIMLTSLLGFVTLVAGTLLVLDRLFYHNGPHSGYITCDCNEDDA